MKCIYIYIIGILEGSLIDWLLHLLDIKFEIRNIQCTRAAATDRNLNSLKSMKTERNYMAHVE